MESEQVRAALVNALGERVPVEAASVLDTLEAHRDFWRPHVVRVVLLAESHVFTSVEDSVRTVDLTDRGLARAPQGFVRLVYCLGYGENELLDKAIGKNHGTPGYWRLFWSSLHDPDRVPATPLLKAVTGLHQRAQSKIEVLQQMRARGIWLLDASLAALYGHAAKPPQDLIRTAIETSWRLHVEQAVLRAKPRTVVVVGKTVGSILSKRLAAICPVVHCINQPSAFLSKEARRQDHRLVHDVCRMYGLPGVVT